MAHAVKKVIVREEAETMKECERTAQGPVSKKNLLVLRRELTQRRQPALFHQDYDLSLLVGIILSMDNSVRGQRGYCPCEL